jgi:hypothetical protein
LAVSQTCGAIKCNWGKRTLNTQRIIVLHALREDSRATTISHATCFAKHISNVDIEYVNIFGDLPLKLKADLVIVTYELLSLRNLPIWSALVQKMKPMLEGAEFRIAMPQDDYSRCDVLDDFVVQHKFDAVFTPITRDLDQLYPSAVKLGVQFHEAFTGYFEQSDWSKLESFSRPFRDRSIDVGQRVRHLPPQLGHSAGIKGQLAIDFGDAARNQGFLCDVSTRSEDVLLGDDWWRFLGNIKFTVSRRGGASMADPTGRLADRVRRYQMRHPEASMAEIAKKVSMKGGRFGDFSAISPRLFEAAALGVCQILEPDDYVDGLLPGVHYIPLESDFSNIDEVFETMRDLGRCEEIVQASQDLLLKSGNFSYKAFVKQLSLIAKIRLENGSLPSFSDSSEDFDGIISGDSSNLRWVQDYVRRVFVRGQLNKSINSLKHGKLLILEAEDKAMKTWAESQSKSLLHWLTAFQSKRLMVESLAIPWRTATSLADV